MYKSMGCWLQHHHSFLQSTSPVKHDPINPTGIFGCALIENDLSSLQKFQNPTD